MQEVTIRVINEIICQVIGLTEFDKDLLYKEYGVFIPSARYQPKYKVGLWDGKIHYFEKDGKTFINLLQDIFTKIDASKYTFRMEAYEGFVPAEPFKLINENYFSDFVWEKGHRLEGQPILLEPHQVNGANALLSNHKGMICYSTGSGKTLISAVLAKKVCERGKFLIIVPSRDLVINTANQLNYLGIETGTAFENDRIEEYSKKCVVTTWQGISSMYRRCKGKNYYQDKIKELEKEQTRAYYNHNEEICKQIRNEINELKIKSAEDVVKAQNELNALKEGVVGFLFDECLDGNTEITMSNGERKKICKCKNGDKILSYNENTKQFEEDVIEKVHINLKNSEAEEMYLIELDNGEQIKITGNHKVLTIRGWVRVDELIDTDEIISFEDNKSERLEKSNKIFKDKYNLILEKNNLNLRIDEYNISSHHLYLGNIKFNNGYIINTQKDVRAFIRKMNDLDKGRSSFSFLYFDDLYSNDYNIREMTFKKIRNDICKKGGKKTIELYGEKIAKQGRENFKVSHIKGRKLTYNVWSKGLTKDTHPSLQRISQSRLGAKNHMYGKKYTKEMRDIRSNIMKSLILNGEFTPNTQNIYTRKNILYNDIKYRSTWEVMFAMLNPSCKYETLRIKYLYKNQYKVYIVDFIDEKINEYMKLNQYHYKKEMFLLQKKKH